MSKGPAPSTALSLEMPYSFYFQELKVFLVRALANIIAGRIIITDNDQIALAY
jgi:hypothetical protein